MTKDVPEIGFGNIGSSQEKQGVVMGEFEKVCYATVAAVGICVGGFAVIVGLVVAGERVSYALSPNAGPHEHAAIGIGLMLATVAVIALSAGVAATIWRKVRGN